MNTNTVLSTLTKLKIFYSFSENVKGTPTYEWSKSIYALVASLEQMLADELQVDEKVISDWAQFGTEDAESFYTSHYSNG